MIGEPLLKPERAAEQSVCRESAEAISTAKPNNSGGEAQRIKLAAHLAKANPKRGPKPGEHLLCILDEPSTGLHFAELDLLMRAVFRLRAAGHTILCIEHNPDILSRADWLVELGSGAGKTAAASPWAEPTPSRTYGA